MGSGDGWVPLGEVGKQLANLASDFDPRTFGFRKLSDLVRKTNSFEIGDPKGGSMRIRTKLAAGSPPKPLEKLRLEKERCPGVPALSSRS
jgi:hypothetical protein